MRFLISICVLSVFSSAMSASVSAALTPEAKKTLTELTRELRPVLGLIRKKQLEEAKAVIHGIEERVKELNIADDERARTYGAFKNALQRAKNAIPVSFEADVAPIIKEKCLSCHGEDKASAQLRMDTYANMAKVGRNGPLLIPRNPNRSLIMARIMTDDAQRRMPKRGPQLSNDDIATIGRWIAGGAIFDGADVTAPVGGSLAEKKDPKPPVKIVMADGSESVSFKDDVAPWMVTVCLRCHSGNRARNGYDITTFESLLTDGDSGSTIVPGDPDNSYIVDLVVRQKTTEDARWKPNTNQTVSGEGPRKVDQRRGPLRRYRPQSHVEKSGANSRTTGSRQARTDVGQRLF